MEENAMKPFPRRCFHQFVPIHIGLKGVYFLLFHAVCANAYLTKIRFIGEGYLLQISSFLVSVLLWKFQLFPRCITSIVAVTTCLLRSATPINFCWTVINKLYKSLVDTVIFRSGIICDAILLCTEHFYHGSKQKKHSQAPVFLKWTNLVQTVNNYSFFYV